jgi:hypothetical protein
MTTIHPELHTLRQFQGLILPAHPTSGTEDDDDDRDDEHAGENEAPVRAVDEGTETPEEFEVDDPDKLGRPEDDDADEEGPEEEMAPPKSAVAVPKPATPSLLGLGLAAVGLARRRKGQARPV